MSFSYALVKHKKGIGQRESDNCYFNKIRIPSGTCNWRMPTKNKLGWKNQKDSASGLNDNLNNPKCASLPPMTYM